MLSKLSWAVTIHRFLGHTVQKDIVDLGPTEKVAGLAYVALSRVKNLSDLKGRKVLESQ